MCAPVSRHCAVGIISVLVNAIVKIAVNEADTLPRMALYLVNLLRKMIDYIYIPRIAFGKVPTFNA